MDASQPATQGVGPHSALDYRNGSDIDSDNAYEARRSQEWIAQDDAIMRRRADESAATQQSPTEQPTTDQLREQFRQSERDYRSTTDRSVVGTSYVARAGDNISKLLRTSNPQAIGNFMRANGLSGSTIQAGQNYFIPEDISAYGDSSALGQMVLNGDNKRLAFLAEQRAAHQQAHWDSLQVGAWSGRTGADGPVWHIGGPAAPAAATAGGHFESMPSADAYSGVPTGGFEPVWVPDTPMPYTEQMARLKQVGVGVVEGVVNGVPKLVMSIASTLWEGAQMQGLSDAGVDPRTSYQIAKQSTSGWWNGELISYDNKEQQLGGFAGELASPFAYGKAAQLAGRVSDAAALLRQAGVPDWNVRFTTSQPGVLYTNPLPLEFERIGNAGSVGVQETTPLLPLSRQVGVVTRNALSDTEFAQAQDLVSFRGGHFVGAPKESFPGIDGWLDGVPTQLKTVTGNGEQAVLRNIVKGARNLSSQGYIGDLAVDASQTGVRVDGFANFVTPNTPVGRILNEGAVNNVYIKLTDGWLNITRGTLTVPGG